MSGNGHGSSAGLEPIGDPDEQTGDFADEHQDFVVEKDDDEDGGEEESPSRYGGGLQGEGPP
jgi:hypothetical protein